MSKQQQTLNKEKMWIEIHQLQLTGVKWFISWEVHKISGTGSTKIIDNFEVT